MKLAAWITIAVAAMVAAVAWRFVRRSKLALAIAVVAITLVGFGLVFAVGGWGGCSDRGDCGPVGGPLRAILGIETGLLALLLLCAGARVLWRRVMPERAPRGPRARRPRAQTDATRMRLRDIALGIVSLVCALFALAMLGVGQGQDRIAGLAVLLFSVAVLLVPISGRVAARSHLRPRLERVDGRPALVIPGSRTKQQLMRIACLCFAGAGLLMAIWPHAMHSSRYSPAMIQVSGIVAAAFFGLGGIASMLLARGPLTIEFLPTGLRWRVGAKPTFAEWEAITAAKPFSIRDTWYLGINATDGGLHIPGRQRWLAGINRTITRADASISLEPFPVDPDRLAEAVAACADNQQRRREIGTQACLEWFKHGVPKPAPASVSDRGWARHGGVGGTAPNR